MATKQPEDLFTVVRTMTDWPTQAFSNWAFAEREDRIEANTVANFQRMGKTFWTHAEKALDEHMTFVSHRLHEDMECVKSLSACTSPEESAATLQGFYSRMAQQYQDHFENQAALMRDGISANAAAVEKLNETAMESVSELGKATEESLTSADTPKPKTRRARTDGKTT